MSLTYMTAVFSPGHRRWLAFYALLALPMTGHAVDVDWRKHSGELEVSRIPNDTIRVYGEYDSSTRVDVGALGVGIRGKLEDSTGEYSLRISAGPASLDTNGNACARIEVSGGVAVVMGVTESACVNIFSAESFTKAEVFAGLGVDIPGVMELSMTKSIEYKVPTGKIYASDLLVAPSGLQLVRDSNGNIIGQKVVTAVCVLENGQTYCLSEGASLYKTASSGSGSTTSGSSYSNLSFGSTTDSRQGQLGHTSGSGTTTSSSGFQNHLSSGTTLTYGSQVPHYSSPFHSGTSLSYGNAVSGSGSTSNLGYSLGVTVPAPRDRQ